MLARSRLLMVSSRSHSRGNLGKGVDCLGTGYKCNTHMALFSHPLKSISHPKYSIFALLSHLVEWPL